jgi:hypothetical protein
VLVKYGVAKPIRVAMTPPSDWQGGLGDYDSVFVTALTPNMRGGIRSTSRIGPKGVLYGIPYWKWKQKAKKHEAYVKMSKLDERNLP